MIRMKWLMAAAVAALEIGIAAPGSAQPVTLRFGQVPSTVRAVTSIYLEQVIAFMGEGGALKAPLPAATRFVDLQYLRAAGVE